MLDSLWPLFRDSFFDSGIESQAVKQGIALSVAVQASEKACFLLHAYLLKELGFSLEEIRTLALGLSFPSRIPKSEKWNKVVQWTFSNGLTSGKRRMKPATQAGFCFSRHSG